MQSFANKTFLVTGGTGFIGSHLIDRLVKQKSRVITTLFSTSPDSYFLTQKLDKKVRTVYADVCDFDIMYDLATRYEVDFIFHFAAKASVDSAYYNPRQTLHTNIMGTVNILECARLYPKIKGIIIASPDKAYGKLNKKKYIESDPLVGNHPYEVSKSASDLIAYTYFKTYNVPVVIARSSNIYGEGDKNFSRIIPGIMKSIIKNSVLLIRSDGTYVRDYLNVEDVVDGYFLLANNMNKAVGETFNLSSEESLSVLELIKLTEKTLKKKIKYKILNIAVNEIPYQSLDYSKIKKRLGWKPKRSLEKSIKNIYRWYKTIL